MSFAAIYVPGFPVQALARVQPELRSRPLAVVDGAPPLERVLAANQQAAQAGVEPGMTRVQAAKHIAEEQVLRGSPECETAAHAALLACAGNFSPRVEDTAADTILLDLTGGERLLGSPAHIARDLARRCSELGLEANVAVASNPDAAWLATRGFPGVTIIPPGREAERLGSLPIDVLFASGTGNRRLGSRNSLRDTLDRWGIRNLRALAVLPEIAVAERLGQEGLRLQHLARGASSRPLLPAEPPLEFEEFLELEYPVEMLEPLAFILHRLLEQLCARLAARALTTTELRLRLGLKQSEIRNQKSEIYERVLRFPVPMLDAPVFLKLLQLDLQAHPPGAPVAKVWLSAEPAAPRPAQNGLFLPLAPQPEKLELTLARIAGVVGQQKPRRHGGTEELKIDDCRLQIDGMAGRVISSQPSIVNRRSSIPSPASPCLRGEPTRLGSPALPDSHRPGAFSMARFAAPTPGAEPKTGNSKLETAVLALRLFRPPLRAVVGLQRGAPARLACHDKPALRGDVVWASGPWRTSGGWYEPQPWDREEWDIAVHNEAGLTLYRIYRDATSGRWFVEGSYD
jgi:protein ImuB